jgi:hypothetical protein
MKKFIKKVKEWFAIRKANKELDDAIIAAEAMFKMTGKRHYVIADNKNRLRVFTWSQLKQMKKQGLFSATVKENDFIKESFYYTPCSLDHTYTYMNSETKDKKRKMWIAYYKAYRM